MNKMKLLKIANLLLFASLIVQGATGIMLYFNLFTSSILDIAEIHEQNGLIFIVLVIIHLLLNWGWVKSNYLRILKKA